MKDKVFTGFVLAASAAMAGVVYGTLTSESTVFLVSLALGLGAAAIGWLGFIRDLRRDSQSGQEGIH